MYFVLSILYFVFDILYFVLYILYFAYIDKLQAAGLFICDLSMHDFSRDLLLASSQQSDGLKEVHFVFCILHFVFYILYFCILYFVFCILYSIFEALESENEKTKLMEESMSKLDVEMKRSDDLLRFTLSLSHIYFHTFTFPCSDF